MPIGVFQGLELEFHLRFEIERRWLWKEKRRVGVEGNLQLRRLTAVREIDARAGHLVFRHGRGTCDGRRQKSEAPGGRKSPICHGVAPIRALIACSGAYSRR